MLSSFGLLLSGLIFLRRIRPKADVFARFSAERRLIYVTEVSFRICLEIAAAKISSCSSVLGTFHRDLGGGSTIGEDSNSLCNEKRVIEG